MSVLAGALSAQDLSGVSVFHGVAIVAGPGGLPLLVNHSDQSLLGFALQEGERTNSILDLNSVAYDRVVAPGGSRFLPGLAVFGGSSKDTVIAVLFGDGTFFGPEIVFRDFVHRIESIRGMAQDIQNSGDRFGALARHADATVENVQARRKPGEAPDFKALQHRSSLAQRLMDRRNYDGDEAVSRTIDSIASLPDVKKGDQQ